MSGQFDSSDRTPCPYCGGMNNLSVTDCVFCGKNLHIPKEAAVLTKLNVSVQSDYNPQPANSLNWQALGRLFLSAGLLFFYLRWFKTENYFSFIDYINLAFHEAGHVFLGFFGRFIMMLGGTIFQLLMPAICAIHFWRQESRLGWQLCIFWIGENFLNISIYAGDAIKQALPLVGGGEHDWTYLLTETGLIAHTPAVETTIFTAGSLVIFYSLYLITADGLQMLNSKNTSSVA